MQKDNKDKKGFYLTLYSVATVFLLLAFAITILNSPSDDKNITKEETAAVDKSNVKPISQVTTSQAKVEEKENVTEQTTNKTVESEISNTAANNEKTAKLFTENDEMDWPVEGQILMDYSSESAIYDKTLDQYRTNDSISISAPLGSEICASADGVVASITKDDEKGVTVSIDHGNGWMSTYSQLQDNTTVSEGQTVYRGEKIGTVAEPTKYSSAIGPHIEFSVFKDEISTDPKLVLASVE
ncbi:MAG: peptidoglycan DD-metalloendopeptidase family protein [Lachnospirales bacterium]